MGPLNSIFAVINPLITANLAGAGIVPTFGSTALDRYAEAAPPRIVWLPTTEDIQPPRGQGGDEVVGVRGAQDLPAGALQPLYTRVCGVECDIWGADRDTTETMINAVVSAAHDALSNGGYGIVAARWLLPEESSKDGEIYRLTFQFLVPVTRVAPGTTTATVTTLPLSPAVPFHIGS